MQWPTTEGDTAERMALRMRCRAALLPTEMLRLQLLQVGGQSE